MKPSDFDYIKVIGRGSFGKVNFISLLFIFSNESMVVALNVTTQTTGAAGKKQKTGILLCCKNAAEKGDHPEERGNRSLCYSVN